MRTKWLLCVCALLGAVGIAVIASSVVSRATEPKGSEVLEPSRVSVTSSTIAITNLQSQMASLEKLVAEHPEHAPFKSQLFDVLQTRSQFLGTYSDLTRMRALVSTAPQSFEEWLLKARVAGAIHDFDTALLALNEAEKLRPDAVESERQRASIRLARRENLPDLRSHQAAIVSKSPSYSNLILMAGIECELGNFDSADQNFIRALHSYRDTWPFPIAFVYFQRGVMWAEKAGNPDRARHMYEEAVHYLPQYVVAQVHLAELMGDNGEFEKALAGLQSVVSAEDPEPKGVLGELLHRLKREQESSSFLQSAAEAYDSLLHDFPLAFSDHGAEFFAGRINGTGADRSRALELARINLQNRRSERAYIVAIEAALAANAPQALCEFITQARASAPVYVPLQQLIAANQAECSSRSR